jgi:hypothetical protein
MLYLRASSSSWVVRRYRPHIFHGYSRVDAKATLRRSADRRGVGRIGVGRVGVERSRRESSSGGHAVLLGTRGLSPWSPRLDSSNFAPPDPSRSSNRYRPRPRSRTRISSSSNSRLNRSPFTVLRSRWRSRVFAPHLQTPYAPTPFPGPTKVCCQAIPALLPS